MPLTIITGKYETGTHEQKDDIGKIIGNENTAYDFTLYFHWFNVMHEFGHAICNYNIQNKEDYFNQSFAMQEPLVNDFAVAYWVYYGEQEKLNYLKHMVTKAFSRFKNPAPGIHYIDYAITNWNNPDFWTFNNYGWFQFSCVRNSLSNPKTLKEMLLSTS